VLVGCGTTGSAAAQQGTTVAALPDLVPEPARARGNRASGARKGRLRRGRRVISARHGQVFSVHAPRALRLRSAPARGSAGPAARPWARPERGARLRNEAKTPMVTAWSTAETPRPSVHRNKA
jgi:hypothetical protein